MSAVADPRDRSFVIRPTIYTPPPGRKRLRELGIVIGRFPTGPLNAITDVPGVRVGHTTLMTGEGPLVSGKGPVRTGITAIIPTHNIFFDRVFGGSFVLNGAGELSGLTQVQEWGLLETPILLTNTMSAGTSTPSTSTPPSSGRAGALSRRARWAPAPAWSPATSSPASGLRRGSSR